MLWRTGLLADHWEALKVASDIWNILMLPSVVVRRVRVEVLVRSVVELVASHHPGATRAGEGWSQVLDQEILILELLEGGFFDVLLPAAGWTLKRRSRYSYAAVESYFRTVGEELL